MKKHFLGLASALALVGMSQTACTKQDLFSEVVPAQTVAAADATRIDGLSQEELLTTMAADPLVVEDFRATSRYAAKMREWFDTTPAAQRDAQLQAYSEASARGQHITNPAFTAAEEKAEYIRSVKADNLIKAKYPQLASLSPEEFGTFYGKLFERLETLPN